ncbi:hypothetical protein ACFOLF_35385 [Paenibacillus sepulcri]|uniref:hypothetical protein n=1 Tax=Paenibacillus sepulcri TaxID=359917 RepID=UPI001AE95F58
MVLPIFFEHCENINQAQYSYSIWNKMKKIAVAAINPRRRCFFLQYQKAKVWHGEAAISSKQNPSYRTAAPRFRCFKREKPCSIANPASSRGKPSIPASKILLADGCPEVQVLKAGKTVQHRQSGVSRGQPPIPASKILLTERLPPGSGALSGKNRAASSIRHQ